MSRILASLRETSKFFSFKDAEQFEASIAQLIVDGVVVEVKVVEPEYRGLEEHWYKDNESGEIWRYCPPEFPDRGVWRKIK